jgi:hypothetical protein
LGNTAIFVVKFFEYVLVLTLLGEGR